jgi:hypothetical protein
MKELVGVISKKRDHHGKDEVKRKNQEIASSAGGQPIPFLSFFTSEPP